MVCNGNKIEKQRRAHRCRSCYYRSLNPVVGSIVESLESFCSQNTVIIRSNVAYSFARLIF